jgi:hypothetical protein
VYRSERRDIRYQKGAKGSGDFDESDRPGTGTGHLLSVLLLQDFDRPQVSDDEVLIRVHTSAVAGDDWHLVQGLPYVARMVTGLLKPRSSSRSESSFRPSGLVNVPLP